MKLVNVENTEKEERDFVADITKFGKKMFFEYTKSNSSIGKMISFVTGKKSEKNKEGGNEEGDFIKGAFEQFINTFKPYALDYRPESKNWADSAFQNALTMQFESQEIRTLSIVSDPDEGQIVFNYHVLPAAIYEEHLNIANAKGEVFDLHSAAIKYGKTYKISLKEVIESVFDIIEKTNNVDDLQKAIFALLTQFKKQDSDYEEVKSTFVIENSLQMPQIEAKRLNP